jgi:hypothetical protein
MEQFRTLPRPFPGLLGRVVAENGVPFHEPLLQADALSFLQVDCGYNYHLKKSFHSRHRDPKGLKAQRRRGAQRKAQRQRYAEEVENWIKPDQAKSKLVFVEKSLNSAFQIRSASCWF